MGVKIFKSVFGRFKQAIAGYKILENRGIFIFPVILRSNAGVELLIDIAVVKIKTVAGEPAAGAAAVANVIVFSYKMPAGPAANAVAHFKVAAFGCHKGASAV